MSNMLRVSGAHESDRRTLMPGLARLVEMRRGRCVWLLASLVVLGAASWTHASGLIPGTYPISVSTELEIKGTVTVNGNTVALGKTGPNAIVTVAGMRDVVAQPLPALDPPSFPINISGVDANDADGPFSSDVAVFYNKITLRPNTTTTFSGGGPFHIKELIVQDGATVMLKQGVYFLNTLDVGHTASQLVVGSAPAIVHIGTHVKAAGLQARINAGGAVTALRVYLHANAEFKGGKGLVFTGILYGPEAKAVELKENVTFQGAIISSGKSKLENAISLSYTAADQAAVSAIDPAETGGGAGNTPPVAHAGLNQAVEVGETVELNGSGSTDEDGHALTFVWSLISQPAGSTATLTNLTSVLPSLPIDQPGDYVVQLLVNDGTVDSVVVQ